MLRGGATLLALSAIAPACAHPRPSRPAADAAPAAAAEVLAAWTELGDGGVTIARVITAGACPTVLAGEHALALHTRAEPSAPYPVRACEVVVPPGVTEVRVGALTLRAKPAAATRIVVMGDTGCRMKNKAGKPKFQACNDPKAWPFASLAARAAALRPDLVIHVGDYFYREAPCPAGDAGCAGAPWGYGWEAWNADFFTPAAPLLHAAPWVMVRGDHERCDRAEAGWFRFLEPGPVPATCPPATPSREVTVGALTLLAIDTATTPDDPPTPAQLDVAKRQLAEAMPRAHGETWLLAHAPVWAVWNEDEQGPKTTTETLQTASGGAFPDAITAVVSGHLHRFQLVSYGAARPTQIVAGQGGSKLDTAKLSDFGGRSLMGATVATWRDRLELGFVVLDAEPGGWKSTTYDVAGEPGVVCHLRSRDVTCAP